MPKLYDRQGNQWVEIADHLVEDAYKSGRFLFKKGAEVNVQLPDGRYGTVPAERLGDVLQAGGTYDLAEERQERIEQAQYDDRGIEALLLAAGRGLTFGLSDVAAEKFGDYSEEELRKLEEYNPTISAVGEIGGAVLPAFFTGGTSTAAQILSKGTLAGQAARAGIATERAVAGAIGLDKATSVADKMLKGGASLGAAAGIEGVLFGAGETISEELLGRTDRTAEQMLANIGSVGLLSGGIGTALGAGPGALTKAFQMFHSSRFSKGLGDKVAQFSDDLTAAMTSGDRATIAKFRDPEFLDRYIGFDDIRKKTHADTRSFINSFQDDFEQATKMAAGSTKAEEMLDLVNAVNPVQTLNSSANVIASLKGRLEEMVENTADYAQNAGPLLKAVNDRIDSMATLIQKGLKKNGQLPEGGKVVFENGSFLVRSQRKTPGLKSQIEDVDISIDQIPTDWGNIPAHVFNLVDDFKKVVGSSLGKNRTLDKVGFNTDAAFGDIYTSLRKHLEDEALFGPAAAAQRKVNAPYHELLKIKKTFERRFMHKVGDNIEANDLKIRTFVKRADQFDEAGAGDKQLFEETIAAFGRFTEAAKGSYSTKELTEKFGGFARNTEAINKQWADFGELLAAQKELRHLSQANDSSMSLLAGGAAYAIGGIPGAVVAAAANDIIRPGNAIRRRMVIHNMKSMMTKRIDKSVSRVTNRIIKNKAGGPQRASKVPSILALVGVKSTGDSNEDIAAEMQAIREISSPDALTARIEKGTADLEDAPMLREELANATVRQIGMLQAAAAKAGIVEHDPLTGQQKMVMSDAGKAEYLQVRDTLADPIGVTTQALEDGTASRVMGRTFAQAFPVLFQEFTDKLLGDIREEAEKTGNAISYADNLQLSSFTGIPLSPTLNPGFIGAMQNVMKATEQARRPQRRVASLKESANRAILPVEQAMT